VVPAAGQGEPMTDASMRYLPLTATGTLLMLTPSLTIPKWVSI
jgi:hypothetical protein